MVRRRNIVQGILDEREHQDRKWGAIGSAGHVNASDHEMLAVLVEEVGEVAKALNDLTAGHINAETCTEDLELELIQVAAVAFKWLEIIG